MEKEALSSQEMVEWTKASGKILAGKQNYSLQVRVGIMNLLVVILEAQLDVMPEEWLPLYQSIDRQITEEEK